MDKRYIKPDGSEVWVHLVVAPLCLSDQNEYRHISLIQDISKRKNMENELKYNNEHDASTGLLNRRYLESLLHIDSMLENDSKRALVGISLSSLHSLNKIYGFHYTLDLIKSTAIALGRHVEISRQLFNLYENQFAFYIKNYHDRQELEEFCSLLTETLKKLLMIERIDAGIGVVEITKNNAEDVNNLFKSLLIASEKAVIAQDDFSFCFFDKKMDEEIIREEEITRELALVASGEKQEELYLHYQPIIDLKNDRICCFEALARLKSSQFGQISPLEFIPLAEETKLIIPLGYQIISQALGFMQKLKANGFDQIGVSINISAIQLLRSDFTETLYQMIEEMDVDSEKIILEITESILAVNYEEINSILGEIKESGIQIAIDDFGTGYSSLARERELNINSLKIDKSFIDKLLFLDPRNAITGDIISMAHKLGHWVVAEGVEYEAQKEYLANNGCDRIQGFLYSRPVDEESALQMLEDEMHKN
ncbi:MAG: EAL domain-containing protein [Clostridiaceae bacterium]|nr:EAL domain-containing protein [Clostridiaceae bacterium]